MTDHNVRAETSRERFIKFVERELKAFERKEREFRSRLKEERAAQLGLPIPKRISR